MKLKYRYLNFAPKKKKMEQNEYKNEIHHKNVPNDVPLPVSSTSCHPCLSITLQKKKDIRKKDIKEKKNLTKFPRMFISSKFPLPKKRKKICLKAINILKR